MRNTPLPRRWWSLLTPLGGILAASALLSLGAPTARAVSFTVVISQFQITGENPADEFIELHNVGATPFDLNGYQLAARRAVSVSDIYLIVWTDPTIIPAGGFYLVANSASYDGATAPDATWTTGESGTLASEGGGIALRHGALNTGEIIDSVGYGTATNAFVEGTPPAAPDPDNSAARRENGCKDTDQNAADFEPLAPAAPRNSFTVIACPAPTETPPPTLTDTPTATTTAAPTDTPTASIQPPEPPRLALSQIYGAGGNSGATYDHDFIEIFNRDTSSVNLDGWSVQYASAEGSNWNVTVLPAYELGPGQYFLIQEDGGANGIALPPADAADTTAMAAGAGKVALVMGIAELSGTCPTDAVIADLVGYGSAANCREGSASADNAPAPDALNSIFRRVSGCVESDNNAADFEAAPVAPRNSASPLYDCASAPPPTETPVPTATATNTATALPTAVHTYPPHAVIINEIAWSGTAANAADEWLELYNPSDADIDLIGWALSDGGAVNIALASVISARGFYLIERTDDNTVSDLAADHLFTGALNNSGAALTLSDPGGTVIDTANAGGGSWYAGTSSPRCSMERSAADAADDANGWHTNDNTRRNGLDANGAPICGTPRQPNSDGLPASPTATVTHTPTISATPSVPAPPAPDGVFVNEFLPDAAQDWNGDGSGDEKDEWIELYNNNSFAVELSGWQLDDAANGGSAPFTFPVGTVIGEHGFVVLYGRDTGLALNNSSDDVRLLKPTGDVADTISYSGSAPDASWARMPDAAAFFTRDCPPTPGSSNCSIAPTPSPTPLPWAEIRLNEFMPAPFHDWNGDGTLDTGDEWVELYNASNQSVDLGGWKLDDGKGGSPPYVIPAGTLIKAHGWRVLFASETQIGLNNDGDTVRLLHPDGTVANKKKYAPLETNKSYSRAPDGGDKWVTTCLPTPHKANCSIVPEVPPTPQFSLTALSAARTLPEGSRVSVLGSVIARPCELDTYGHQMTLADETAGIQVLLEYPAQLPCSIPYGEQIVVTGEIRDYFGLRTIYPTSIANVTRHYGAPREPVPQVVRTGDLDEALESRLLQVEGRVSNGKNGNVLWVNDGTGMVEVYADSASGASFAGITRGSLVRMTGIGYQYNEYTEPNGGYYLRPRAPGDVTLLELAEPSAPPSRKRVRPDLGELSIAGARAARPQSIVTIGGVVTVPPGVIAERDFWVQDGYGGIRVHVAAGAGAPPALELNARVKVKGIIVNAFGARELRVEQPDAIQAQGTTDTVAPRPVKTAKADFSIEGQLVSVEGWVTRASGREVYVDDGSGEVLVYLDADTRIRYPRLARGDAARVTGVISRFRDKTEILPRFQTDVQFQVVTSSVSEFVVSGTLQVGGRASDSADVELDFRASARGRIGRRSSPALPPAVVPPTAPAPQPASARAPLTLTAFILLGAAGIAGALAFYFYRRGRTAPRA